MADIYQIIENNGTPKSIEDKKARTNIAPYFNVNNANAAGDLILSDTGILYRFNATYSAGTSWNSRTSKEQVNIDDELKQINSNINAIDSSLAIVSDGNTHIALAIGQYVYVKNHSSLAEGLYIANSAIGADVALTSSNVTYISNNKGGFNKLNEKIDSHLSDYEVYNMSNIRNTTYVSALGYISRYGRIINWNLGVINVPTDIPIYTQVVATKIPERFRPKTIGVTLYFKKHNDTKVYIIYVSTSGEIGSEEAIPSGYYYGSATWVA